MINFTIEENNENSFKKVMNNEITKSIKHFERELVGIRTGRAHTSMVEDIKVSCYGQDPMPLKSVSAIGAPEARLITIQPWDASTIADITKGIRESDLGITPVNDGKTIRLQLPEMSTSRREEMVKVLNKKLEECCVGIRSVRKDFNNLIRDAKKNKIISEDFANRLTDTVQKITDTFIAKAKEMSDKKAHDLRAF